MTTADLPPCPVPDHDLIPATEPGEPVTAVRCVWCCHIQDVPADRPNLGDQTR